MEVIMLKKPKHKDGKEKKRKNNNSENIKSNEDIIEKKLKREKEMHAC